MSGLRSWEVYSEELHVILIAVNSRARTTTAVCAQNAPLMTGPARGVKAMVCTIYDIKMACHQLHCRMQTILQLRTTLTLTHKRPRCPCDAPCRNTGSLTGHQCQPDLFCGVAQRMQRCSDNANPSWLSQRSKPSAK